MSDATCERWLPVPGYEGLYEVSDWGRVRSQRRKGAPGGILKPVTGTDGYVQVGLSRDGRGRSIRIQYLVMNAFGPPRPSGPAGKLIRHLDGNPANNQLSNLSYGSYGDNMQDMLKHGTHWQTRKTHCPQNHEYTPENTRIGPDGGRDCRACDGRGRRAQPSSITT